MKILETNRLILRPWKMTDLEDFYEYAKNPSVGPNAGWKPHTDKDMSGKVLKSFIEKEEVLAIVYKENNKVIGSVGNHSDGKRDFDGARMIGYVLSEDYWGKGFMSEAVKRVITYLFEEENYELLSCYHYSFNNRSKRVIEKCGFKYEGTFRMASKRYDGRVCDDVCYSITKDEYYK